MPQEQTIQVFTFDELPDTSSTPGYSSPKEKARDWYRQGLWDYQPTTISETFEQELEARGLDGLVNDRSPSWSLGYSQGDGVAFAGTIELDEIKPIEGDGQESDEAHIAEIKALIPAGVDIPSELSVRVVDINHHYSHWNSFDVEVECYAEDDEGEEVMTDEQIAALGMSIRMWLQDLSRYLEKIGYEEIEYQEADEQISESCDANGYLFDETGRPVHHLVDSDYLPNPGEARGA